MGWLVYTFIYPYKWWIAIQNYCDFETAIPHYIDGAGRKYIPYWAPALRDSAQLAVNIAISLYHRDYEVVCKADTSVEDTRPFSEILPQLAHKWKLIVMVNARFTINRFTLFTKAHTNQYTTILSLKFPVMLTGKMEKLHILSTSESPKQDQIPCLGFPWRLPKTPRVNWRWRLREWS